jgi:hypothetical protein
MTYNLALRYIFDHGWHKQDYLLSDKFQPDKMKTLLQKMFVSVPGIQEKKSRYFLLRTPKVPRQLPSCKPEGPVDETQTIEEEVSQHAPGEVCSQIQRKT